MDSKTFWKNFGLFQFDQYKKECIVKHFCGRPDYADPKVRDRPQEGTIDYLNTAKYLKKMGKLMRESNSQFQWDGTSLYLLTSIPQNEIRDLDPSGNDAPDRERKRYKVLLDEETDEFLNAVFTNPVHGALRGRDSLYERIRTQVVGISRRRVAEFLARNEMAQIKSNPVKHPLFNPILTETPRKQLVIDITYMTAPALSAANPSSYPEIHLAKNPPRKISKTAAAELEEIENVAAKANDGTMKFMLVMVDHFSKFCWVRPLLTRQALEVVKCVEALLETEGAWEIISCDNGVEFGYALEEAGKRWGCLVKHGVSHRPTTQGAVEKMNHTIKSMIYNILVYYKTLDWTHWLPLIVHAYNTTVHSSHSLTPFQVFRSTNANPIPLAPNRSVESIGSYTKPSEPNSTWFVQVTSIERTNVMFMMCCFSGYGIFRVLSDTDPSLSAASYLKNIWCQFGPPKQIILLSEHDDKISTLLKYFGVGLFLCAQRKNLDPYFPRNLLHCYNNFKTTMTSLLTSFLSASTKRYSAEECENLGIFYTPTTDTWSEKERAYSFACAWNTAILDKNDELYPTPPHVLFHQDYLMQLPALEWKKDVPFSRSGGASAARTNGASTASSANASSANASSSAFGQGKRGKTRSNPKRAPKKNAAAAAASSSAGGGAIEDLGPEVNARNQKEADEREMLDRLGLSEVPVDTGPNRTNMDVAHRDISIGGTPWKIGYMHPENLEGREFTLEPTMYNSILSSNTANFRIPRPFLPLTDQTEFLFNSPVKPPISDAEIKQSMDNADQRRKKINEYVMNKLTDNAAKMVERDVQRKLKHNQTSVINEKEIKKMKEDYTGQPDALRVLTDMEERIEEKKKRAAKDPRIIPLRIADLVRINLHEASRLIRNREETKRPVPRYSEALYRVTAIIDVPPEAGDQKRDEDLKASQRRYRIVLEKNESPDAYGFIDPNVIAKRKFYRHELFFIAREKYADVVKSELIRGRTAPTPNLNLSFQKPVDHREFRQKKLY